MGVPGRTPCLETGARRLLSKLTAAQSSSFLSTLGLAGSPTPVPALGSLTARWGGGGHACSQSPEGGGPRPAVLSQGSCGEGGMPTQAGEVQVLGEPGGLRAASSRRGDKHCMKGATCTHVPSTPPWPLQPGRQAPRPAPGQETGQTQFAQTQRTRWGRGGWPVLREAPRARGPCQCGNSCSRRQRAVCVKAQPSPRQNLGWGKAGWSPGHHQTDAPLTTGPGPANRHPQSLVGAQSPCYLEPGHLARTPSSPAGHEEKGTHHQGLASTQALPALRRTVCLRPEGGAPPPGSLGSAPRVLFHSLLALRAASDPPTSTSTGGAPHRRATPP